MNPLRHTSDGKLIRNSATRLVYCPGCEEPPTGEAYLPVKLEPAFMATNLTWSSVLAAEGSCTASWERTDGWLEDVSNAWGRVAHVFHDPRFSTYGYIVSGGDQYTLAALKRVGADLQIKAVWLASRVGSTSKLLPGTQCEGAPCSGPPAPVDCDQCVDVNWPLAARLTLEQYADGLATNWTGDLFRSSFVHRCVGRVELAITVTGCSLQAWELAELIAVGNWAPLRCRCAKYPTTMTVTVQLADHAFSGKNCCPGFGQSEVGCTFSGGLRNTLTLAQSYYTGAFDLGGWWLDGDVAYKELVIASKPPAVTTDSAGRTSYGVPLVNFRQYGFNFLPPANPARCLTVAGTGPVENLIATSTTGEVTQPWLFENTWKRRRVMAIYHAYDLCCLRDTSGLAYGTSITELFFRFTGSPTIDALTVRAGTTTNEAVNPANFTGHGVSYGLTAIYAGAPAALTAFPDNWWKLTLDTPWVMDVNKNLVLDFCLDNYYAAPLAGGGDAYFFDSGRTNAAVYAYTNSLATGTPTGWSAGPPTVYATSLLPQLRLKAA